MALDKLNYDTQELEDLQNSSQDGVYLKAIIEKINEIIDEVNK